MSTAMHMRRCTVHVDCVFHGLWEVEREKEMGDSRSHLRLQKGSAGSRDESDAVVAAGVLDRSPLSLDVLRAQSFALGTWSARWSVLISCLVPST